jgi:hypothetical protein
MYMLSSRQEQKTTYRSDRMGPLLPVFSQSAVYPYRQLSEAKLKNDLRSLTPLDFSCQRFTLPLSIRLTYLG